MKNNAENGEYTKISTDLTYILLNQYFLAVPYSVKLIPPWCGRDLAARSHTAVQSHRFVQSLVQLLKHPCNGPATAHIKKPCCPSRQSISHPFISQGGDKYSRRNLLGLSVFSQRSASSSGLMFLVSQGMTVSRGFFKILMKGLKILPGFVCVIGSII